VGGGRADHRSIIYMSALERTRDFAVFKAVGVDEGDPGRLALQAVIIAMLSAALGVVLSVLAPLFPMRVDIPPRACCCRSWPSRSG
jgi:putative ABC transport system permease protein